MKRTAAVQNKQGHGSVVTFKYFACLEDVVDFDVRTISPNNLDASLLK
jgi:hypothetical protein